MPLNKPSKSAKTAKSAKTTFYCTACGNEQPRWFGHCPACQAWNTASEAPPSGGAAQAGRTAGGRRWVPQGGARPQGPVPLAEVTLESTERTGTGMRELDRVLGGGIVPGSLLLVGGDPGIGKSTLLLQLARSFAASGRKVLYVSGEESEQQIRLRAARLGDVPENLLLFCETDLETVLETAAQVQPDCLIADSIQTLSRADLEGGDHAEDHRDHHVLERRRVRVLLAREHRQVGVAVHERVVVLRLDLGGGLGHGAPCYGMR